MKNSFQTRITSLDSPENIICSGMFFLEILENFPDIMNVFFYEKQLSNKHLYLRFIGKI